jgi:hypothetical protein
MIPAIGQQVKLCFRRTDNGEIHRDTCTVKKLRIGPLSKRSEVYVVGDAFGYWIETSNTPAEPLWLEAE